ncbi:MAG: hypothetical protein EXR58_03670 [Chloroflexi bacterium]|nr:hypothetical protein [Chloroflexota bacterium]
MRVHPTVTKDEVYRWLEQQTQQLELNPPPANLDSALAQLAEAMATVSAVVLPDDVEPLFP